MDKWLSDGVGKNKLLKEVVKNPSMALIQKSLFKEGVTLFFYQKRKGLHLNMNGGYLR